MRKNIYIELKNFYCLFFDKGDYFMQKSFLAGEILGFELDLVLL